MRIVTVGSAAAAVREVYLHAAKAIGLEPSELALIAAHDWDINGANKVGLITGFVERKLNFHRQCRSLM